MKRHIIALMAAFGLIMNAVSALGADIPRNIVVATIPGIGSGISAVVSPDSATVYVANLYPYTVSVIDAATNTVRFIIPISDYVDWIAISPDGRSLYVTTEMGELIIYDTSTYQPIAGFGVGNPLGANAVTVSPDGELYVATYGGITIVNTATNSFIPLPVDPTQIVFSPDGKYAYAVCYIDPQGLTNGVLRINTTSYDLQQLFWGKFSDALGITITPDGQTLYIAADNGVVVCDIASNKIKKRILLPQRPGQLAITPDGKYLYAPSGEIFTINTANNRVVGPPIVVGNNGSFGVVIAPNGQYAYTFFSSDDTMSVIDIRPQVRY